MGPCCSRPLRPPLAPWCARAPAPERQGAPPQPPAGCGDRLLAVRRNTVISADPRLRPAPLAAMLAAYGWAELDPDDKDESIKRLRALNARRAAEEAAAAAEGDNR